MKKINITVIAVISSVIVFTALTIIQSKIIGNKPMISAIIAVTDIIADSELKKEFFKEVQVPLNLAVNTVVINSLDNIEGKFAKENMHKGQIVFEQDIDTEDRLKILKEAGGLERIAIKIKSSENGVAYQVKAKDRIHLYFSGRYGAIKETIKQYNLADVQKNDNSIYTFCLLRDLEVLGVYDSEGRSEKLENFSGLDTVVIATDKKNVEIISNLRTQGIFDITK